MTSLSIHDVVALVEKLEAIAESPETILGLGDDGLRRKLREAGAKLSRAMETHSESVHRICNSHVQLILARVGVEKGIFNLLSETESTLETAAVAQKTEIDPVLARRLLQYYQSVGIVAQPEVDAYTANNVTRALAAPVGHSGIKFLHDVIGPGMFKIPQYFRENGYQNTSSEGPLPWMLGHHTTLSVFKYLQTQPDMMALFLSWMKFNRTGLPVFLDVLNFEQEHGRDTSDSTVLFVDVGGATGHQAILFRRRNPNLRGRVVVQELPATVGRLRANPPPGFDGIEAVAHDFFTLQPIKGARAYYLRSVLHDWSDEKCIEILNNLRPSMTEDSVVLIDEIVLSEKGAPHRATQYDIIMMVATGAMERTSSEWEALLSRAGFKIRKIWKYAEDCDDCIIVAVPGE